MHFEGIWNAESDEKKPWNQDDGTNAVGSRLCRNNDAENKRAKDQSGRERRIKRDAVWSGPAMWKQSRRDEEMAIVPENSDDMKCKWDEREWNGRDRSQRNSRQWVKAEMRDERTKWSRIKAWMDAT